jgi:hypothetical protein
MLRNPPKLRRLSPNQRHLTSTSRGGPYRKAVKPASSLLPSQHSALPNGHGQIAPSAGRRDSRPGGRCVAPPIQNSGWPPILDVHIPQMAAKVDHGSSEAFLLFSQSIPSHNLGFVDAKATDLDVPVAGKQLSIHQSPGLLSSNRKAGTTGAGTHHSDSESPVRLVLNR